MKRGRLSPEEEAQVERLAERKLTAGQIAMRMDRHPATINFAMTRLGLRAPARRSFAFVRGGREVRSFSGEEDAWIQALRCQDFPIAEIVRLHGKRFDHPRSYATIRTRLVQLANLQELADG